MRTEKIDFTALLHAVRPDTKTSRSKQHLIRACWHLSVLASARLAKGASEFKLAMPEGALPQQAQPVTTSSISVDMP